MSPSGLPENIKGGRTAAAGGAGHGGASHPGGEGGGGGWRYSCARRGSDRRCGLRRRRSPTEWAGEHIVARELAALMMAITLALRFAGSRMIAYMDATGVPAQFEGTPVDRRTAGNLVHIIRRWAEARACEVFVSISRACACQLTVLAGDWGRSHLRLPEPSPWLPEQETARPGIGAVRWAEGTQKSQGR